ncbi:MAG: S4 domain-containing protein YaaA [Mollicutes bacterium]|nr:S4 domain-containing protein YaaA [Mollicutes bacterium]MDY4642469.1 S4 domain-containing protein YaaA [Candidatus Enterosoma sp.]MCI7133283.1 S4 domain-containing protein YaaA [Mollicutes bacterium]MCI7787883.1 S4 domain-containing protein YaaA [Mollicutes bacterium]MDD7037126.1 S4 domain-containing protein YaaA [Mollicutes bacterium]
MVKNGNNIKITGEYITLGQLLKFLDLVSTGGEEKIFLRENEVLFNGEKEQRRGKKLRDKDQVTILGVTYTICA